MGFTFFKKVPYNTLVVPSTMLKHVKVGKYIEYMRQKPSKNMLIVKSHPGMKCLNIFFYVFSSQNEISSLPFSQGWVHPGMKFIPAKTCKQWETLHHRQGRFHSRTSFIPGWNFTCKHPLSVRHLVKCKHVRTAGSRTF